MNPSRPSLIAAVGLTLAGAALVQPLSRWAATHPTRTPASASNSRAPTPQEGAILRSFIHDVLEATNAAPGDEALAVKIAIARHPEVLLWTIEGRDLNALLHAADLAPPETGKRSIASIALNVLTTKSQDILAAQARTKQTLQSLSDSPFANHAQDTITQVAREFARVDLNARIRLLGLVDDSYYADAVQEANRALESVKVSEVEAFRAVLENSSDFELEGVEPRYIRRFIEMYFDELALEDRKRVMLAYLKLPPASPVPEQLTAIVNNLPPTIQKLFQLIGQDAKSPQVRSVMQKILDGVQPFEDPVKPILTEKLGRPWNKLFRSVEERPIAAGTIGQVYLAEMTDGTPVVIKVRRPGLRGRVEREIEALNRIVEANQQAILNNAQLGAIAKSGILEKLIARLKETTLQELDFLREARLVDRAKGYIDPKLGLDVIHRPDSIPANEEILVMTRAEGMPLSRMGTRDLEIQQKALYNLIKKWLDLAIFAGRRLEPDGEPISFFHADLHGGNIFLKALASEAPKTRLASLSSLLGSSPDHLLTLIDFGNSGEMSLSQRRSFVKLALGAVTGSVDQIVDALGTLGSMSSDQKASIARQLSQMDFAAMDMNARLSAALEQSFKNGFEVPESITKLLRGKFFLEAELGRVNEELWVGSLQRRIGSRPLSRFLVGAMSGTVTTTLNGLEGLSSLAEDQKAGIASRLHELDYGRMKPLARIEAALKASQDFGVRLNPGEGARIAEQANRLRELRALANAGATPNRAYLEVVTRRLGMSLPAQLFSQNARDSAIVELRVLAEAVNRKAREYFRTRFLGCFRRTLQGPTP